MANTTTTDIDGRVAVVVKAWRGLGPDGLDGVLNTSPALYHALAWLSVEELVGQIQGTETVDA